MNAEIAIEKGYKYFCLNCNRPYKEIPTQWEEKNNCLGAEIDMCSCGCDLFMSFEEYLKKQQDEGPIESRMDILDL
jgi:hypothetical protein